MSDSLCLRLTRVIKTPRTKCFAVWTKPELLASYLASAPMTVSEATGEAHIGGEYRIALKGASADGKYVDAVVTGTYTEIVSDERITFTWKLLDDSRLETIVTVEFRDVEEGTELILTHSGFTNEESFARHGQGWETCLEKMGRSLDDTGYEFRVDENADKPGQADGYARTLSISAPCETVFDALATLDGPKDWWTPLVTGSAETGSTLRFDFQGVDGYTLMRVDHAVRPSSVQWTCVGATLLPDWIGTVIEFDLTERGPGGCELRFRHRGLTPALECFDLCESGWNYYLPSLKAYAETGQGTLVGGG